MVAGFMIMAIFEFSQNMHHGSYPLSPPEPLCAIRRLFEDLKIPVHVVTENPVSPREMLPNTWRAGYEAFEMMQEVFFLGMVDEKVFEGEESGKSLPEIREEKKDYDGLLIFGVELKPRDGDRLPTRGQLAEITRAFNREFHYTPVVVVFRYGKHITLAAAERIRYKQTWREGEKAGKVAMLKDISVDQPHRGHLAILQQLVIPTTGSKAVKTFTQLYYYWQSVFSIAVLNKDFYEQIIRWFEIAIKEIGIPSEKPGSEKHKDFTIRLIARIIFIWFLKRAESDTGGAAPALLRQWE
jgi:adenine-specific DNA-methyltransferase